MRGATLPDAGPTALSHLEAAGRVPRGVRAARSGFRRAPSPRGRLWGDLSDPPPRLLPQEPPQSGPRGGCGRLPGRRGVEDAPLTAGSRATRSRPPTAEGPGRAPAPRRSASRPPAAAASHRRRFSLARSRAETMSAETASGPTEDQLEILEYNFNKVNKHPDPTTLCLIAAEAGLSEEETQVRPRAPAALRERRRSGPRPGPRRAPAAAPQRTRSAAPRAPLRPQPAEAGPRRGLPGNLAFAPPGPCCPPCPTAREERSLPRPGPRRARCPGLFLPGAVSESFAAGALCAPGAQCPNTCPRRHCRSWEGP